MDRPEPQDYQPRLTWWRHTWRMLLTVSISLLAWAPIAQAQWRQDPRLLWADLALGAMAYVAVFWRRRWPVPIAISTNAVSMLSGIAAGPATLAAVSMATHRRWRHLIVLALVVVGSSTGFAIIQPNVDDTPLWLNMVISIVFTAAALGWGMYIGSRRELIETLHQRAERAETEQEFRVSQARANERARIAREMHDVLAHRISQVSMHAGALAFRDDLDADQMRSSAGIIQEKANEALTDLRAVLGVLRDPATGELRNQPQPTMADVPALVEEARDSGMNVEYDDLLGDTTGMPDVIGRTVYRIVQEGLTNARKHAPGALVEVRVSGTPEAGVDVLLRNPMGFGHPAPPRSGLGLIGLAERAALNGGRLEHTRDGSTFVLHGWIPWAV
ncbi:sensor histidine kinase [Nocardioides speluncae]|uniref:sensor histidine kinase n=1 Tax=Nocardioides speluncae TaxID=2670337 RepID=UPI000D69508E|nr:histidine kinase [Nocardioides speluncae]